MVRRAAAAVLPLLCLARWGAAQQYCWPCAARHGLVGKYTQSASDPTRCYAWMFRYLNNVVPGQNNTGDGSHDAVSISGAAIHEAWDAPPNILSMELNECGTTNGDAYANVTAMGPAERRLVSAGERLPTGGMHQCPCSVQGRGHIIHASNVNVTDFSAVEDDWGKAYVDRIKAHESDPARMNAFYTSLSAAEGSALQHGSLFGMHSILCAFHASGPCSLAEVERGVARQWSANFSRGYTPLMDNNLMLWTATLGPLLDAFARDGVEFYPMRWAPAGDAAPAAEVYSVLASPCGKQLLEVAAADPGGRPAAMFHRMPTARAVFPHADVAGRAGAALSPVRISRAVGTARLDAVLTFYGAKGASNATRGLAFQTEVVADDTAADGTRSVTLRLAPGASAHLQLWARPEAAPAGPAPPAAAAFAAAARTGQVRRPPPPAAVAQFCVRGEWSVDRYSAYILATHESVMTPAPADPYTRTPPVGGPMDVFLDDHISWDCTAPQCDMARGGAALYSTGARVRWTGSGSFNAGWAPYSYDPAGYGFELHWWDMAEDYRPHGTAAPICFRSWPNGTCPSPGL